MALVDDPKEMIQRMFYLQAREGFDDLCQFFSSGLRVPQSPFGEDDLVFGIFRKHHFFSQHGIASKRKTSISWHEIDRSSNAYIAGKDILTIEGRNGARIKIDLTNPKGGRPAYRIEQLVRRMSQHWSQAAYTGLPPMEVEAFFAKANGAGDFAVNLYPMEPRPKFKEAFLELKALSEVLDIKILPGDQEDEGMVYADEIAVISNQPDTFFAPFLEATRASSIAPANENDRKKLKLAPAQRAWILSWR